MTQQQEQQQAPPTWMWLAIIFAIFIIVVVLPLQYLGGLFEKTEAATTTAQEEEVPVNVGIVIDTLLGITGIVIGLIIWRHQQKQSDKIDKQSDRIEDQGMKMRKIVDGVDIHTSSISQTLDQVKDINSRVEDIVEKAKAREDKRKHHNLSLIKNELTRLRGRVVTRTNLLRQRVINNQSVTLEQWDRERELVRIRERAQIQKSMEVVSARFDAIEDLMMDLYLPTDIDNALREILDLLDAIHDLNDPTEQQSDERAELIRSVQHLRSDALVGLSRLRYRLLQEIAREEK